MIFGIQEDLKEKVIEMIQKEQSFCITGITSAFILEKLSTIKLLNKGIIKFCDEYKKNKSINKILFLKLVDGTYKVGVYGNYVSIKAIKRLKGVEEIKSRNLIKYL